MRAVLRRKQSNLTDPDPQPPRRHEYDRHRTPVERALTAAAARRDRSSGRFDSDSATDSNLSEYDSDPEDEFRDDELSDPDITVSTRRVPRYNERALIVPVTSTSRAQAVLPRPSHSNLSRTLQSMSNNDDSEQSDPAGYRRRRRAPSPPPSQNFSTITSTDNPARNSVDNQSVEAVRNDSNHRRFRNADPTSSTQDSYSDEDDALPQTRVTPMSTRSERNSHSQPELGRPRSVKNESSSIYADRSDVDVRARSKASMSTILNSTRKGRSARISKPEPSSASIYSTRDQVSLKSSSRSLRNGVVNTRENKSSATAQSKPQQLVRNARGEIEWKDAPAVPMMGQQLLQQTKKLSLTPSQRRYPPSRALDGAEDQDFGYTSSDQDYLSPVSASPTKASYKAVGSASQTSFSGRPRIQRHPSEESGGYHTADDEDIEAREWERLRDRQMELDRLDVYQLQQRREEEARIARRRAERERANAEFREQERLILERRKQEKEARRQARIEAEQARIAAEQAEHERLERLRAEAEEQERIAAERKKERREAKRLAREKAEREEAERLEQQRIEEEARRLQEKEEARQRKIQAKKEAAERKIKEEEEARLRAIQEEKEAEERRIREAEEAARRAEEEAARKEAERLAAIEAERLAKEAAIQAAIDAVLEQARLLEEAKRQVMEEDEEARLAGRRGEESSQQALTPRPLGSHVSQDKVEERTHTDDKECDTSADREGDASTDKIAELNDDKSMDTGLSDEKAASDAVTRQPSDASNGLKSSTLGSDTNRDAPSSTAGSSDMPATPADERSSLHIGQRPSVDIDQMFSPNAASDERATFKTMANSEVSPMGLPNKAVVYEAYRFRDAVRHGPSRMLSVIKTPHPPRASIHLAEATLSEAVVQPIGPYREGGVTYGRGWCAHGLADPSLLLDRRRYVRVAATTSGADSPSGAVADDLHSMHSSTTYHEKIYSDLGELIWTATTPDVISRLVDQLDYVDIKALRQTSQSIRFALGQLAGREIVLARFLGPVGYQPWIPSAAPAESGDSIPEKDPMPLTFADCEDFLLSFDLLPEYNLVGSEFARAAHKMDPRYPQLARASTRAYNRVLTRLRMQPSFKIPTKVSTARLEAQPLSPLLATGERSTTKSDLRAGPLASASSVTSPWKPGRAGFFRAWVPSTEVGGWLSDVELARCERELFIAGIWPHLKKGDVIWDCAVSNERNEGKYVFDGRYLRDLSFMFDRVGHLPSWLNAFHFVPSYYHNIVQSGDPSQPVVYLDVLPWRDQIVSTMRLVQDQVETLSPQGARYRVSKWLYRAVINITFGQVISDGVDAVDKGWHGRIVIETEGTAEHAKELISRCAGPAENERTKARLLASVMDSNSTPANIPAAPAPVKDAKGNTIMTTSPWTIVRTRSRPGLIWVRPLDMRDRVVF